MTRDYYAILGVAQDASRAAIKAAYRRIARAYHPDANGGDRRGERRFIEATGAYRTLSDDELRSRYDQGEVALDTAQRATSTSPEQPATATPASATWADQWSQFQSWARVLVEVARVFRGSPRRARWDFDVQRYRSADGRFAARR